jgi:hypothetical protein
MMSNGGYQHIKVDEEFVEDTNPLFDLQTQMDRVKPHHYTSRVPEPITVILGWDLDFALGNVIKYVARFNDTGEIDDLRKAREYLDIKIRQYEN